MARRKRKAARAGECGLADERPRFILHLLHVGIGDRPYVGRQ